MNYIVYKTTNLVNGKIYVGVHRTENPDVFDGYYGHGYSKKNKQSLTNYGLPSAIRKYGIENFKRETLFVFPYSEEGRIAAFQKEAEIVDEEFIKRKDTYNIGLGGFGLLKFIVSKKINQYTLDGKFIKEWECIADASRAFNNESIPECLKGRNHHSAGYQWRYSTGDYSDIEPAGKKGKPVYQFDLDGNFIREWPSACVAAKSFDCPVSAKASIYRVCSGKKIKYHGFYWSFEKEFKIRDNNQLSKVAQYDDDGNFITCYKSMADAARAVNVGLSAINRVVSGINPRAGGYRWRYYDGNQAKIEPLTIQKRKTKR